MKANGRVGSGARRLPGAPGTRAALGALFLFSCFLLALGQSDPPRRVGGIMAGTLFPTGDFDRHGAKTAIGASFFSGWRIGETPFLIGVEAAGNFYGVSLFEGRYL